MLVKIYHECPSLCFRDGSIRVGDRIIAINGVTVITATLETAQRLIRESNTVVHIVIEYDIAVMG